MAEAHESRAKDAKIVSGSQKVFRFIKIAMLSLAILIAVITVGGIIYHEATKERHVSTAAGAYSAPTTVALPPSGEPQAYSVRLKPEDGWYDLKEHGQFVAGWWTTIDYFYCIEVIWVDMAGNRETPRRFCDNGAKPDTSSHPSPDAIVPGPNWKYGQASNVLIRTLTAGANNVKVTEWPGKPATFQ